MFDFTRNLIESDSNRVEESDANGLPLSNLGRSPYWGVAFHSHRNETPWFAVVSIPEHLRDRMPNRNFTIHLSEHSDERDASYVAGKFNENIEENFEEFLRVGQLHWRPTGGIPQWNHPAVESPPRQNRRQARYIRRNRRVIPEVRIDNRWGRDILHKVFKGYMKELRKYGKDMVIHDLSNLTVNEFSLRYGIEV